MRLMRLQEVISVTGLSRPTIYKRMAGGTFPLSVPLGERAVAWVESEIHEWIMARIEERDGVVQAEPTCMS